MDTGVKEFRLRNPELGADNLDILIISYRNSRMNVLQYSALPFFAHKNYLQIKTLGSFPKEQQVTCR